MEEDFKFSGHVTSLARCFIVLAQVFSSYRARPCVRQNEEAETTDAVGLGSVAGSHARFPNHTMAACIEAGCGYGLLRPYCLQSILILSGSEER